MKNKLIIALLTIVVALGCTLGLAACGDGNNGTYYLYYDDKYVMSEYVTLDGGNWTDSNGMGGKYEIKDNTVYFYMDIFGQQAVWQTGEIGNGKLVLQGFSGPMTYYKEGMAHTHSFGDWQVISEPTCTTPGEKVSACSCGETTRQSIPALGHIVKEGTTNYIPPTCRADGNLNYTCDRCGKVITEEVYEANIANHYIDEGADTSVCSGCGTKLADSLEFTKNGTTYALTGGSGDTIIVPVMYAGKQVSSIGDSAFMNCKNLGSITIPNSITSIGDKAFGYSSLKSIIISDSVTEINDSAFYMCSKLENIEVDEENQNYASQDGILYNKAKTEFLHIPKAIKGNVTISNGITEIKDSAFANLTSLERLTIPDGATKIGMYAFSGCGELKRITIPDSVIDIGSHAFEYCSELESISIPYGVTEIGDYTFYDCASLASVYFGNNSKLTTIGSFVFPNCSFTSITIPDSVTSIGRELFVWCDNLERVIFENKTGWKVSVYGGDSSSSAYSVNVDDPVQNAKYLTGIYRDYSWQRQE